MLEPHERLGVVRAESDRLKIKLQQRAERLSDITRVS